MRRPLIILGTSGLAREIAMIVEQVNAREHRWEFLGFVGDAVAERGKDLGIGRVLGDDEWLLSQDFAADLLLGIGYPGVRARVMPRYLMQAGRFGYPNLIHPSATLDYRRVELGSGNVVSAGCALTCDIQVGEFNLFNLHATVGHDSHIGSFNVVNPSVNLSGGTRVGDRVFFGTGCQVLENLSIGDGAVIGAGAVVISSVEPGATMVGVPARPVRKEER